MQATPARGIPMPPIDGEVSTHGDDPTMPPPTPRRWTAAFAIAIAGALTAGLVLSGGLELRLIAAIVLAMQILLVVAYVLLRRSVSRPAAIAVGIGASIAADGIAVYTQPLQLDYLAYVVAAVFFATIVGQLARTRGRRGLTDGMATGVTVAVIAVGMSTLIGLVRHPGGGQALAIGAIAIGTAVMAARAIDITMPNPRINRQVPRGAFGVVIGAMVGTAMAAYAGVLLDGLTPQKAALGGLVVGLVGVLGDLAAGYTHAGRRIAGDGEAPWPLRYGLGPLLAFGAAAPVLYLLGVFYLVRAF
ncbi:hypothetical protein [Stackebrandtia soli]|uniref:hypothetical protein n=1 Tax=Stackebrandtia soli TaxID=1892856 RepID=UPI0039ECFE27